jgi:glutamate carboxypeptidase
MDEDRARRILDTLRGREDAMVALLERLVLAESPSGEPAAQAAAFGILAEAFGDLGYEVTRIAGSGSGDHLRAAPAGTDLDAPYQLLVGHLDTVWPSGTLADMPARTRDDRFSGPGAYDMKGGLVQMIHALAALGDSGLHPPLPPVAFINGDEETGSRDSGPHIHKLARGAGRAFILEPSFGPAGKLKTSRKGVGRFTLRITGRASHAGLSPEEGISAILEASHQIQRLFALNDHARGVTVNVGTIDGGLHPNVIAPEVTAVIDARVPTAADAETVERAILGLTPVQPGVSLEVTGAFGRPPLEPTPRNRELWHAAERAADALGIRLEEAAVGGGSDGNTTSLYTATLDGLGPVGDGAHAPHEYVQVSQMPERAALLALLLMAPPGGTAR